jgi:hypothetical protein
MSQQIRRVLVALGLMAVLSLATPSSSQAAGFQGPGLAGDFTARLWVWLESLLPGAATPSPARRPAMKTGSTTLSSGQPTSGATSTATKTDQGNMIDPNGFK